MNIIKRNKKLIEHKPVFSNDGFIRLQRCLYQLDDETLQVHAELARYDLEAWISGHFRLGSAQKQDFSTLSIETKGRIATDIGFAILNRLMVCLKQNKTQGRKLHRRTRWLMSELKLDWGKLVSHS